MIDLEKEELISLSEAGREMARLMKRDKPFTVSMVYRWISLGANGAKLEFIRFGRKTETSREAVRRFVYAQTESTVEKHNNTDTSETEDSYVRSKETQSQLEQMGLV